MLARQSLFDNIKQCEMCHRTLPEKYEDSLCPFCKEVQLFQDVKEFIRSNTVNEYEVADHFDIPLRQVKMWIKEGRIEYCVPKEEKKIQELRCQSCGAPIRFGTLCPRCLKKQNGRKGYQITNPEANNDTKMHYLNKDFKQED